MTVTPLGRDQNCSLKNREPDVPALLVPGSREDEVQSNRGGLAPTSRIQEPREPAHPALVLKAAVLVPPQGVTVIGNINGLSWKSHHSKMLPSQYQKMLYRLLGESHQQSDPAVNPRCYSNDLSSKTCSLVKLWLNCYGGNKHFLWRELVSDSVNLVRPEGTYYCCFDFMLSNGLLNTHVDTCAATD
ncbi:hypothetical protein STEG23_005288 [Scotinomys teguina]